MLALVPLVLGMATGCAGIGGQATEGDSIRYDSGPDKLVLQVATGGGFVPANFRLTELPSISLYGDGTLIAQGPQIAIFPGPAMPNLQVTRVTAAGMQRILRAARAAGLLGPGRHYDYPGIADAPTTTFTVTTEGGVVHKTSAYALGMDMDDARVPEADRRGRQLLAAFQEDLSDVRGRLGQDVAGPDQQYVPRAVRIFVSAGNPADAAEATLVKVVEWPLGPLGSFGAPRTDGVLRCGVLDGQDLERVRPLLAASHQLTFWRSEGKTYRLDLRPLLPDESGCPPDLNAPSG